MNGILNSLLPTGIIATVSSTVVENPWISSLGEKVGVICIMGYFLYEKARECKQLREENKELTLKIINKCPSCELARAANKLLIEEDKL